VAGAKSPQENPAMKKTLTLLCIVALAGTGTHAVAQQPASTNPYLKDYRPSLPVFPFGMPSGEKRKPTRPYEMSRIVTEEEKTRMMRSAIPLLANGMSMDLRDVMNHMATKYKVKEGLTFDDVVESMKLRANALNFKLVGHSPLWKDIRAVLGDETAPRMEVFHYCDIAAGREVLRYAPESLIYLPCRIGIMEDADKNLWVVTLDWNVAWLDSVRGSMGVTPELTKAADDIRKKMDEIMRAAAAGDL
jgi:uncharacterized protein (DUF302 family)